MSSKLYGQSSAETGNDDETAASEDPFTDDDVSAVIDDVWDELTS
jgi:hypothetical protein